MISGFDMALHGLANINVELTSRCNKSCWMCGRRERDRLYHNMEYGDMDFDLVTKIAQQVHPNIVVQFHNNGEGLLYHRFGEAVALFKKNGCITNIVTNGIMIVEKSQEIIDNLDSISISVFENDTESEAQYQLIAEFLRLKGDRKPFTTLRLIGKVDPARYQKFNAMIIKRILHAPRGSFHYRKKNPTIPEIGICLDFLNHLAIDWRGNVSVCVRFDSMGELVLGNIGQQSLDELWNCLKRREMMALHVAGRRYEIPFCKKCEYWGVPTG